MGSVVVRRRAIERWRTTVVGARRGTAGRRTLRTTSAGTVVPTATTRAAPPRSIARWRAIRAAPAEPTPLRSALGRWAMVTALVNKLGQLVKLLAAELIVVVTIEPLKQSFQRSRAVTAWTTSRRTARPATRTGSAAFARRAVRPVATRWGRTGRPVAARRRRAVGALAEPLAHLFAALAHGFAHRLPLGIV